jgi:hypothetical protein
MRTDPPTKLFDVRAGLIVAQSNTFAYSPHPDGKRFLVNALAEDEQPVVNVITNWQKAVAGRTGQ